MPYTVPEARVREVPFTNNLLINPGFEIWQRGSGTFSYSVSTIYTADEWLMTGTDASVVRSTAAKFGAYCLSATGVTTGVTIRQGIESYKSLEGQWVTFSAWVNSSDTPSVQISDYNGTGEFVNSLPHSGSGNWELLTVHKQIREGLTSGSGWNHDYGIRVMISAGAGQSFLVDGAVCAAGYFPEGLMYRPPLYADDFRRCCRYYYASQGSRERTMWSGKTNSGTVYHIDKVFPSPMAATPTVTLTDGGRGYFGASSVNGVGTQGFWERATASGTSNRGYFRSDWTAEVS